MDVPLIITILFIGIPVGGTLLMFIVSTWTAAMNASQISNSQAELKRLAELKRELGE